MFDKKLGMLLAGGMVMASSYSNKWNDLSLSGRSLPKSKKSATKRPKAKMQKKSKIRNRKK